MRPALIILCVLLFATFTRAADVFDAPCARYGVPKALVVAIAQTESSLNPLTVNVAGKSYYPSSRDEALRLIHAARARKLSHDIGLMQINNWWLERLGISPEVALEPANNATIGVWILAGEIRRHGYGWKAVGAYHSPTPARQAYYARAVNKRYVKLKDAR